MQRFRQQEHSRRLESQGRPREESDRKSKGALLEAADVRRGQDLDDDQVGVQELWRDDKSEGDDEQGAGPAEHLGASLHLRGHGISGQVACERERASGTGG